MNAAVYAEVMARVRVDLAWVGRQLEEPALNRARLNAWGRSRALRRLGEPAAPVYDITMEN